MSYIKSKFARDKAKTEPTEIFDNEEPKILSPTKSSPSKSDSDDDEHLETVCDSSVELRKHKSKEIN